MDYTVREIKVSEYPLLNDFLYEAIFVPEGSTAPPKSIIDRPELQVYVLDFGKAESDCAFVAEAGGKVVGAIWARIMDDYGHIDDDTPSLAIAVKKPYRGRSIGTALMERLLVELKERGCGRVSLSVQKANYAVKLYLKTDFQVVNETDEEYIMAKSLTAEID